MTSLGFLVAGGHLRLAAIRLPLMAGLGRCAVLGAVPILGGVATLLIWAAGRRNLAIGGLTAAIVLFVAGLAVFPTAAVDDHKAVRSLVTEARTFDRGREIRLASYQYTQPSLVFYNQREVQLLLTQDDVVRFLRSPLPAYLFVPEPAWNDMIKQNPGLPGQLCARKWDLYKRCDILVVSNR
jgi:hypothetical protein